MKLVNQEVYPIDTPSYKQALEVVTTAASTCYQSSPKDKEAFVRRLIKSGHTSVIEHVKITFGVLTDRAVSHELVRHRIASYSQESQRYCAYREDVEFVIPHWYEGAEQVNRYIWEDSLKIAELNYKELLNCGLKPQDARGVLPNATATRIVCTFNFRSLLNFFELRCSERAHPDIRRLARFLHTICKVKYPAFFERGDDETNNNGDTRQS